MMQGHPPRPSAEGDGHRPARAPTRDRRGFVPRLLPSSPGLLPASPRHSEVTVSSACDTAREPLPGSELTALAQLALTTEPVLQMQEQTRP